MVRELYERVKEHEDRPKAIETLNTIINYTEHFLVNMKNFTGEDQPFTEVEYGTLEKLISGIKVSKFSFQHLESFGIFHLYRICLRPCLLKTALEPSMTLGKGRDGSYTSVLIGRGAGCPYSEHL